MENIFKQILQTLKLLCRNVEEYFNRPTQLAGIR